MKTNWKKHAVGAIAMLVMVCMMITPALAAAADHNGPGKLFHMPDGTQITRKPLTEDQKNFYLGWERRLYNNDAYMYTSNNEIGTLHVAVGETIILHASQVTMGYIDDATPRTIYRLSADSEVHTDIDTKVKKEYLDDFTHSDMFHVQESINGRTSDYYCMEWTITGLSEGVDYLWYQDSPFEAEYIMIVVGGGSSSTSSGSNASSSNSSEGSASSGSTSGSNGSSTGTSSGSSSTQNATTGGGTVYTVQSGDTLSSIALNFYGNHQLWPELQKANQSNLNQTTDGLIFAGFGLLLPDTLGGASRIAPATPGSGEALYTVKAGDTLGTIALAHYGDMARYKDIYNRNSDRLADAYTLYEGQIIVLP